MSKLTRFATPLIAVAMMTAPMMMTAQSSQASNQNTNMSAPAGAGQDQAYKDGMEAAKLDTVANRKVDPTASYLYNHPPVKKAADKEAYRSTFTQGYKAALTKNNTNGGGL